MKYINYKKIEDKKRLIEKLSKLYESQYDIRLCQLISNLHGTGPHDVFFTYDDQLEEMVDAELEHYEELIKEENKKIEMKELDSDMMKALNDATKLAGKKEPSKKRF